MIMKYFLDSAKLDEIKLAYNTFGIDGVTTNPRHIMLSGKPFLTAITDIANWIKEEGLEGYEKFPVSVEINPNSFIITFVPNSPFFVSLIITFP